MMIAVDVETRGLNARNFILGCIVDENLKERYFYKPEDMWNYIIELGIKESKRGHNLYVYAHNHQFDFLSYGRDFVEDENINMLIDCPLFATYTHYDKQIIYFLDSMSFYRFSLEQVGEVIGFEKSETPEFLKDENSIITPERIEEIKPYCARDCIIVMKAMQFLKKKVNDLGYYPRKMLTSGQLALSYFKHYTRKDNTANMFMLTNRNNEPIGKIIKSKYSKFIRKAYRGGRNEMFQGGYFNSTSYVDINSLYPYIMSTMKFPDLKSESYINNPLQRLELKEILDTIGVSHVIIQAPNIDIPYLPITFEGYQIYPKDCVMEGTWTNLELKKAVSLGYQIMDMTQTILYKPAIINPFKSFIKELYHLRLNSESDAESTVYKLLMNNLYGKFAQMNTPKDYKFIPRKRLFDYEAEGYKLAGVSEDKYIVMKKGETVDGNFTNPIISTLITAGARDYLYDFMKQLGTERLIYVDTDSIMMKGDWIPLYFKIGKELGNWKIEQKGVEGFFKKEKEYYIGDSIKMSGVRKSEQTKEAVETGVTITTKRIISLKGGVKRGIIHKVGEFEDIELSFSNGCKKDIIYPKFIKEDE